MPMLHRSADRDVMRCGELCAEWGRGRREVAEVVMGMRGVNEESAVGSSGRCVLVSVIVVCCVVFVTVFQAREGWT